MSSTTTTGRQGRPRHERRRRGPESGVNPGDTPVTGRSAAAAGNVLTNDTDPDAGDIKTVQARRRQGPITGTYGTLTLGANGTWNYALDNLDGDTEALAQGGGPTCSPTR